jgi:hypothetical protein
MALHVLHTLVGLMAHVSALVAVVLLAVWVAGGALLRVGGAITVLVGLLVALGHPLGLLFVALGVVAWMAGHWHYALRHHTYKSPLARRLFLQLLPARLDPTRRWAIPTTTTTEKP